MDRVTFCIVTATLLSISILIHGLFFIGTHDECAKTFEILKYNEEK